MCYFCPTLLVEGIIEPLRFKERAQPLSRWSIKELLANFLKTCHNNINFFQYKQSPLNLFKVQLPNQRSLSKYFIFQLLPLPFLHPQILFGLGFCRSHLSRVPLNLEQCLASSWCFRSIADCLRRMLTKSLCELERRGSLDDVLCVRV